MSDLFCPLKEAAKDAPRQIAIGSTSFQTFDRLADELSWHLHSLGIRPGDRIAALHHPSIEFATLFFAAWRIGASICPLSLRLPTSQIETHLHRLDAKLFVHSFPMSNASLRPTRFAPLAFPSALFFTSGSTALPKIAVLSIPNLLYNAKPVCKYLNLQPGDGWLLNLPLYHVGGMGILFRCILSRARVIFDTRDPSITHLSAVPTQLHRATPVYPNLRCLLIGGAPISTYPNKLPCFLSYGLTEMGSLVTALLNPQPIEDNFPLGIPLPHRELRLSEQGEIEVRSDCLFQGYWQDGKIESARNQEGWFPTGDMGRLSDYGIMILGRKDWQFISGGENIQPEEIEKALTSLPEVIEAAVVPIKDAEFGQRPAAFVHSNDPSFDLARMKAGLIEQLAPFKIPKILYCLNKIPKNGLKINRKILFEIANKTL